MSKYVVERNPYWEKQNILTGYWYDEETISDKIKSESGVKEAVRLIENVL